VGLVPLEVAGEMGPEVTLGIPFTAQVGLIAKEPALEAATEGETIGG
jgi:hypothetical protein